MIGFYHVGNAQKKTCNTPSNDDILELNTLSISKCDAKSKNTNRTIASTFAKDRNAHYVRKNAKHNSKTINALETKTLLFSVVDEIPLFPKCYNGKDKRCFNSNIQKHFAKNFHPENASEDGITGRLFIQFIVNTDGEISDVNIRGIKNAKDLSKEVKRVLNKLPVFITGKHQGIPVPVKYSLPLNFNTD